MEDDFVKTFEVSKLNYITDYCALNFILYIFSYSQCHIRQITYSHTKKDLQEYILYSCNSWASLSNATLNKKWNFYGYKCYLGKPTNVTPPVKIIVIRELTGSPTSTCPCFTDGITHRIQ